MRPAASERTPPMVVAEVQPWLGASITVHTSRDTPGDRQDEADRVEAAGVRVTRGGQERAGRRRGPRSTIGMFTKKIEPQQKCSSSQPPVTGPRATARPDTPDQMPMALARSVGSVNTLREDGQRRREDQRGADAHGGPGARSAGRPSRRRRPARRCRRTAPGRSGRAPLRPKRSPRLPAASSRPANTRRVGVDDPLQLAGRGAELAAQRGQGHVDDGVVDDHEEQAEAQHRQDSPAPLVDDVGGHRSSR